jgi:hypothetical protein
LACIFSFSSKFKYLQTVEAVAPLRETSDPAKTIHRLKIYV